MKKMNNKGFSLVELIIVIAIMAILIAVLAPQYIKYVEKSRKSADLDNYQKIIDAVQVVYADPENSGSLTSSGTVTVACTTSGTNCADTNLTSALKSIGVDLSGIKTKSKDYGGKTLTLTFSGDNITITVNDASLAKELGITTT